MTYHPPPITIVLAWPERGGRASFDDDQTICSGLLRNIVVQNATHSRLHVR